MPDILRDNIRDDYGEDRPNRRVLRGRAVDNATSESLRSFVEIHTELSQLVHPADFVTRYIGVAASTGVNRVCCFRNRIISKASNRTNTEIQAMCHPSKSEWQGSPEVHFSGHDKIPVKSQVIQAVGTREGQPAFRERKAPTARFVRQTIDAVRNSSLL